MTSCGDILPQTKNVNLMVALEETLGDPQSQWDFSSGHYEPVSKMFQSIW